MIWYYTEMEDVRVQLYKSLYNDQFSHPFVSEQPSRSTEMPEVNGEEVNYNQATSFRYRDTKK